MDKPTLYLETTIPSYLLAEPTRDVISLARQDITRRWWQRDQANYAVFVSGVVFDEAGKGDAVQAEKRLEFLRSFPVLTATAEVRMLIGGCILKRASCRLQARRTPRISPLRASTRWSICVRGTSGIWRTFLRCGACAS